MSDGVPGGEPMKRHLMRALLVWLAVTLPAGGAEVPAPPTPESAGPVRRMVVTIDDLPIGPPNRYTNAEQAAITEQLIATLKRHQVPAIGFVNENKLIADGTADATADGTVDPARVALLARWLDAGFELGNHGYAHLDLHRVDVATWTADVLRGERVLRPLLAKRGRTPRYFRHPFLHTGRSLSVRDQTTAFLAEHGYRVAPVTIDNQEWIFGGAYARAGADTAVGAERRQRLGEAYVDYMLAMVRYYEQQSLSIVGEAIPQILLIHAYALNGDWLDELLTGIVERGYQFIPLDEALEHPAYRWRDTFTGGGGITWLHRWAITCGMPGATFAGEPELPDWLR